MDIKYRSAPLEGYITDSAGNVLRNTTIRIKEEHPGGLVTDVESVKTDNNGYFITSPLKKGLYSVFDGGVRLSEKYHNHQFLFDIPAFAPNSKSAPSVLTSIPAASTVVDTLFLQIEPDDRDVDQYDHVFETFDMRSSNTPSGFQAFTGMPTNYFASGTDTARLITNRRFDVIYNDEITGAYVQWLGVPAIIYDNAQNSQLILPLDQYSQFPKRLKVMTKTTQANNPFTVPTGMGNLINLAGKSIATITANSDDSPLLQPALFQKMTALALSINIGDIVLINNSGTAIPVPSACIWTRLVSKTITSSQVVLTFQDWAGRPVSTGGTVNKKSSYLIGDGSNTIAGIHVGNIPATSIYNMFIFDGITTAMNISTTVSPPTVRRRFNVFESQAATTMLYASRMPYDNEMFDYLIPLSV